MGVELVPTPKAPKNLSLAIRFIAKVLSTALAPIWSQRPRAQNAGYGEQPVYDFENRVYDPRSFRGAIKG